MAGSDIETNHADVIHDTQFDYYGRFMATASSDKTVKVFGAGEGNNGQLLANLTGHDGPVWMLAWAHPAFGVCLATASYDQKAIVWKGSEDGQSWKPSTIVTAHSASVNAVAFAPQPFGLALATAGSDGAVFVTGRQGNAWADAVPVARDAAAHPMGALGVSWAPMPNADAPVLLASGGADKTVKVWARGADGSWQASKTFADHSDWVRDVAFSPDAASRHIVLASCSQDKTVIIRRAERSDPTSWETSSPVRLAEAAWRLSWSPSGSMLLVTTADGQAFVLKQGADFASEWVRTPVSANEVAPQA